MKTILMLLLMLSSLIPPAFSQSLTKPEIAADLGSKTSYTKQEVVDIVFDMQTMFEDELTKAKEEVVKKYTDDFQRVKDACNFQIDIIESERDFYKVMAWIELGVFTVGMIVWGATK